MASPEQLERRARARRAGLASGRVRRARIDPCAQRRRRREHLQRAHVRLVDREEFERRDYARRLAAGLEPNARGTETLWQLYRADARALQAKGQGFLTTNGQRARALEHAGRPRCARTVQRAHQALHQMGLLRTFHDRRGLMRPGRRDRLRVQFAPSYVAPPSAAPTAPQRGLAVGAGTASIARPAGAESDQAGSAPPGGGRTGTPPLRAAHGGDQEEGPGRSGEAPAPEDLDAIAAAEERFRARWGDRWRH